MSFAAHKARLFRDSGDAPLVVRKRSEGRIKTYPSNTDARAWCVDTEDRRQYILDLIRADHEKCALGKYVPIEVLIDTLLANKNADIEKLRQQVEELQRLLDMYSKLDLTEDQKRMLAGMKQVITKAGGELDGLAERSGSKSKSPRAAELVLEGKAPEESEGETEVETETGESAVTETGAEGEETEGVGEEEAAMGEEATAGEETAADEETAGEQTAAEEAEAEELAAAEEAAAESEGGGEDVGVAGGVGVRLYAEGGEALEEGEGAEELEGIAEVEGEEEVEGVGEVEGVEGAEGARALAAEGADESEEGEGELEGDETGEKSKRTCGALARAARAAAAGAEGAGVEEEDAEAAAEAAATRAAKAQADAAAAALKYDSYSPSELKSLVISKDAEVISLKNALAAKSAECNQQNKLARTAIEQLETLRDIMEERDTLKKQLEESMHELQTLKRRVDDPCVAEIAALEAEIDRLRSSGQLSPDDEAEVIRKEVDVLKKYCAKLSSIQEENHRLKTQVERMQELSGIPGQIEADEDEPDDPAELKNRLRELKRKFAKLTEVMDERDKLKKRVEQLEAELLNYGDLPEEVEMFRQRSQMLDDVLDERDNLQKRLERLKGMEEELLMLKKKADRVDELERQLDGMNGEVGNVRRSSALEMQVMQSERDSITREIDNVKAERDMLRMKAADNATMQEEIERLRYRAKESEVLRIERDRLKIRLDELAAIEVEYMQLLDKTRCIETIKAEREMYKSKYEELLGLECECDMLRAQVERFKQIDREREALLRQVRDCECCIADQEDEIKRLVTHVDRLSQGSHQQQDRMQKALTDMRAELEQKTSLIATSEEQLAGVQDQLKSTIAGVSCESTCLRARIEELESELEAATAKLQEANCKLHYTNEQLHNSNEKLQSANGKLHESFENLKQKENEINALQGHLKEKDSVIHSLNAEQSRSSAELAQLQKEMQQGKAQPETFGGDKHLETMLSQSKCAVRRVAEELGKHYQEWDCMQGKVPPEDMDYQNQDDLFAKYTEEKRASLQLSNDVAELQAQIRELQQQLAAANETIAKLRGGLEGTDRLSAENKALRRHSTEVQEVAKEQIEELVEHLKKAKERIAELEAKLAAGGDNCDDLRQKIEGLESERAKLQKLVQQFQEDQASGGVDVGALRIALADMEEQLQKETKLREAAEAQLKEAEERLANLNKQLNSLSDNIQEKVRRSSITETELEAELLKLRAENGQLKENIKSMGDGAARRTSQVAGELDVLADQNKQLLKDKLALESELASLKQQLENLMNASGDAAALDALRKERDALQAQVESQKSEMENIIQKMSSPDGAADLNREQLEKERREKEELQNMIKGLQSQIGSMAEGPSPSSPPPTDSSAINDAIAKLTAQLQAEQAKAAAAESALKQLQSDSGAPAVDNSAELKQRIQELEAQLKAAVSGDSQALLDEINSLRSKIKDLEGENAVLKSASGDNNALLSEMAALRARIKDLEGEYSNLKASISSTDTGLLKEEIAMLKAKIADLELQNKQLAAAAAGDDTALLDQLNSLQQKLKDQEAENLELKGKLTRMHSEMSSLRRVSKDMASDHAAEMKRMSYGDDQLRSLEEELMRQKRECAEAIAELKAQHERELKNINGKYNDSIAKLQGSHEEVLKDINKEYEKESDNLRSELRSSKEAHATLKRVSADKGSLTVKTVENVSIKPSKSSADAFGKPGICNCGKGLEIILHKILKEGMRALAYEELQFLHTKTCEATATLLGKRTPPAPLPQPVLPALPAPPCAKQDYHSPQRESENLSLTRRMSGFENELMKKQRQAQQKVGALQIAVRMERQRLEELKKSLETEKQRNCELMCKIGAQSRAVANMQVERDMMRKQSSFHEEKVHKLMARGEEDKERTKNLEDDLYKAKQRQKRDSEALESMRIKLEKSLNNEMVLKMQMDQRTKGHGPKPEPRCTCHSVTSDSQQPSSHGPPSQSQTSSFYTELTVQDVNKKRNFVHHCCMKQRDRPGGRSSSQQPSSRRCSDDE